MFWTLKTNRFWKQNFGENEKNFVFILKTAGKRVNVFWTLKTKKIDLQNLKTLFFLGVLEFFVFSRRLGISKRLDLAFQNLKNRFEIFQINFWKNIFCLSLVMGVILLCNNHKMVRWCSRPLKTIITYGKTPLHQYKFA